MRQGLYCILDTVAAEIYGGILRVNNDEVARRAFHENLGMKETPLKNPRDYICIHLGSIDTDTGIITPSERRTIATGADWADANNQSA